MSDVELKLLDSLEEQIAVRFTGRVNILSKFNRQYMGHILFKDGEIIQVLFQELQGLKAFYKLVIEEFSLQSYNYVVEPEVVEDKERQIHYPYAVIRNRVAAVLKQYRDSIKFRPPENVKILASADFLNDAIPVTYQEFEVLKTLTEWNRPFDIYQHCPLLDHEITLALVGLRKKGGLKIVAQNNPDDSF
jgi:hypothetical protein